MFMQKHQKYMYITDKCNRNALYNSIGAKKYFYEKELQLRECSNATVLPAQFQAWNNHWCKGGVIDSEEKYIEHSNNVRHLVITVFGLKFKFKIDDTAQTLGAVERNSPRCIEKILYISQKVRRAIVRSGFFEFNNIIIYKENHNEIFRKNIFCKK